MSTEKDSVHYNLMLSPELDEYLEQLAVANHTSKRDILLKSIALFGLAVKAKAENKRIGILNQDKQLETEIEGF